MIRFSLFGKKSSIRGGRETRLKRHRRARFEPLESRNLLAVVPGTTDSFFFTADDAPSAGAANDGIADTFWVRRVEDTLKVNINGVSAGEIPLANLADIELRGSSDVDKFFIEDLGAGFTAPITITGQEDGRDKAILHGSAGNDLLESNPDQTTFTVADSYTITVDHVDLVHAYGEGGGNDRADLEESAGSDQFIAKPDVSYLWYDRGAEKGIWVESFEHVEADATIYDNDNDFARLVDSDGDDYLVGSPELTRIWGSGADRKSPFAYQAHGFDDVTLRASSGGQDIAWMEGSEGNDQLIYQGGLSPRQYKLYSTTEGGEYSILSNRVETLKVFADQGGSDSAFLVDSAGNDVFDAGPGRALLSGSNQSVTAKYFGQVTALAVNGGSDAAVLVDSKGDDEYVSTEDTFAGTPGSNDWAGQKYNLSDLSGDGFSIRAKAFDTIDVSARRGGNDSASIDDTFYAGDVFTARPDVAVLEAGNTSYLYIEVTGFDDVRGYSKNGGDDRTELFGGEGDDVFTQDTNNVSTLEGPGYVIRAESFQDVRAWASGEGDIAHLYDGPGPDFLSSTPNEVRLDASYGSMISAFGFSTVHGYSENGGSDTARLQDTAGDDRLTAEDDWALLHSDARDMYVHGYGDVTVDSSLGGNDTGNYNSSSLSFTLTTTGDWV